MTSRQTAAICGTILLAAAANLAGGFAIERYLEKQRPPQLQVESPFTAKNRGLHPSADQRSPLARGSLTDKATLRRLVETELPEATVAEQQIWAEESNGLRPDEIRDLLRMRRRFGSDVSLLDEPLPEGHTGGAGLPTPANTPLVPVPSEPTRFLPDAVPAPVPVTDDDPRYNPHTDE